MQRCGSPSACRATTNRRRRRRSSCYGEQAAGVKGYKVFRLSLRNEPALLYALARYQRKAKKYVDAAATLTKLAQFDKQVSHPEPVWIERRMVIRDLLGPKYKKHWTTTYGLAAAHGFKSGTNAVEGEFLAGWMMLRYLDQPPAALEHFLRLTTFANSRAEKARAFYWLGRAYSAMGRKDRAVGAYREAAQHEQVYYGQLARDALGLDKTADCGSRLEADARSRNQGSQRRDDAGLPDSRASRPGRRSRPVPVAARPALQNGRGDVGSRRVRLERRRRAHDRALRQVCRQQRSRHRPLGLSRSPRCRAGSKWGRASKRRWCSD